MNETKSASIYFINELNVFNSINSINDLLIGWFIKLTAGNQKSNSASG